MIHGFLFLFKVKQTKAPWVFCAHREENQIAKCRTSLKIILQCCYLHANLFFQPPHFSTDKSHSPSQDWCQNCPNQMDKGAELFPVKVQIFTQSAVFTVATHPWLTLLGTWTTEVMRITLHWVTVPSPSGEEDNSLGQIPGHLLGSYTIDVTPEKFITESNHYVFTDFSI